ncbi:MAG: site-specific integrase [Clostridia bacterium]|nr:site-specific integrase [Clostridia bacterium]
MRLLIETLKESGDVTLRAAVCLGAFQGLRRGEAMGLKWRDIDFEKGVIPQIYETYTQVGSKLITKPPKTEKSKRKIVLTKLSIEALKDLEEHQRERGTVGEYIFLTAGGARLNPTDLSNKFHEFLDAHNLRLIRFHDLRHTYATLALESGVPINKVSGALGHSTTGTTFAYYIHSGDDSSERVNEAMKDIWEGL